MDVNALVGYILRHCRIVVFEVLDCGVLGRSLMHAFCYFITMGCKVAA